MFKIGIDSVEVIRISTSLRNSGFLERYYGSEELADLQKVGFKAESIAEGFSKR